MENTYHHYWAFGIALSWNAQHYGKCFTMYLVQANQLCQSYFKGEPNPPISTPWGAYNSAASHSAFHFKPFVIMTSLPYTGRVRNPVVGHESNSLQVVFNVHHTHIHDSTHPSLFTELGTTHIYVEYNTAGYSHISHTSEQCW